MQYIYLNFTRDKTQIIKGIAIIFMMILHVGGGGNQWITSVNTIDSYPIMNFIHPSFKLCVGIFAFMIGYGYAFAKNKNWQYSIKHVWALLKVYWVVLLLITVPTIIIRGGDALIFSNIHFDIQNLFGIDEHLNWYSWFVYLFIFAIIVLPLIHKWIDKRPLFATATFVVLFYLIEVAIHTLIPNFVELPWIHALFFCCELMPTILLGYYFSKEQIFQKIPVPKHWYMVILSICVLVAILFVRKIYGAILGFSFDIIYAPLAIFCILIIFNIYKLKNITKILTAFGNASVWMWFLHALFFVTYVRDVYQPLILISKNGWIITLWAIILTYCVSWVLMRILKLI